MTRTDALWICDRCGRSFANRNQTHSCRLLGDLDSHFEGSDLAVREIFDRIVGIIAGFGPVEVLAEKSRIALHARMSFAAFVPRRHWLDGHLILATPSTHPRFTRVEIFSAHNVLHGFRLSHPADVDEEFSAMLRLAYEVGMQRHLAP